MWVMRLSRSLITLLRCNRLAVDAAYPEVFDLRNSSMPDFEPQ